ncbi:uncharacterized protein LOC116292226 [Actinia tenebrosa]|uniref:Uncharacterized protein LOC116292226 n=1 Tax=Actinia tenebrosa TaxID=6105 RepID=A0A6P8HHP9_ACTTE|nr:uncharacterized protein LOC116292226 [Actinia tenebrosa]
MQQFFCKAKSTTKTVSYRKLKSIDLEALKDYLRASKLIVQTPSQLNDLVSSYNKTLSSLLDKHAPLLIRSVVIRHRVPWLTDEIRAIKRQRRRAERKWRRTKLDTDQAAFKALKNRTTYVMNSVRREFYTDFVNDNSDDQRKLFSATKKLLGQQYEMQFPLHSDVSCK